MEQVETHDATSEEQNEEDLNLESGNRISKLPGVEGTINIASNLYGKAANTLSDLTTTTSTTEDSTSLESVHRLAKIPVIESTLNIASSLYEKVKDMNSVIESVMTSTENGLITALETAKPVTNKLKGPLKRVDTIVCSGLDIIEDKVPAVKMAPSELVASTKQLVVSAGQSALGKAQVGANKLSELATAGADKMTAMAVASSSTETDSFQLPVVAVQVQATGDSTIDSIFHGECQKCTSLALEATNGKI